MKIPQAVMRVVETLQGAGHQTFLAGGCVRDMRLGREPKDFDVATAATPDQIKALFRRTLLVGEAFGVVRVLLDGDDIEVATFRADGKYTDGRRPDEVVFTTAEVDVKRRDLTINALLYDPIAKRVIDYVGGELDLDNKVLRAVGDPAKRFAEDRLRMLRAVRFAAQLPGFSLTPSTYEAIKAEAAQINLVSRERITQELSKIWMSPSPSKGWGILKATGLMAHVCPCEGPTSPIMRSLERLEDCDASAEEREIICWALAGRAAKPRLGVEEHLRSAYRLSNQHIRRVVMLLGLEPILVDGSMGPTGDVTRALLSSDAHLIRLFQRVLMRADDPRVQEIDRIARDLAERPLPLDQVPNGHDLMHLFQGAALGRALRIAGDAIMERRTTTKEGAIEIAQREMGA